MNNETEQTVYLELEDNGSLVRALQALLHSRKFLLLVFGVVQTLVAYYADIPAEVWASIDALVVAVIAGIAHEDAAEKR